MCARLAVRAFSSEVQPFGFRSIAHELCHHIERKHTRALWSFVVQVIQGRRQEHETSGRAAFAIQLRHNLHQRCGQSRAERRCGRELAPIARSDFANLASQHYNSAHPIRMAQTPSKYPTECLRPNPPSQWPNRVAPLGTLVRRSACVFSRACSHDRSLRRLPGRGTGRWRLAS
jgi:hypothetical protein